MRDNSQRSMYEYAKDASSAPSSGTMDSYAKKHKPAFDDEGLAEDVSKKLALCVARYRLPLSIVESPLRALGTPWLHLARLKRSMQLIFPALGRSLKITSKEPRTIKANRQCMHESAVTLWRRHSA